MKRIQLAKLIVKAIMKDLDDRRMTDELTADVREEMREELIVVVDNVLEEAEDDWG